jgi:ABC-2 type transport system permease protein
MYGMNQPVFFPINTGLEKLLSHYGASVKKAYVMDESCFVSRDQVSGEMSLYFAPIIKNEKINHKLDFLENIKELIMIKISPVEIDEERIDANGLKVTELFSSSSRSWEMAGQINLMPWMIRPPDSEEEMNSFPLAYLIEGQFPSYFADKPIPEKPVDSPDETVPAEEGAEIETEVEKPVAETNVKRVKPFLPAGRPGRIFLIGAADILQDNVLDDEGKSPNAVFLLNTLDYLNDRGDLAVMRSKNQTFNPLRDTQAVTRTFFKMVNIAGLPIMFILFGFVIYVRRKAKKKAIEALFNSPGAEKEKRP